MLIDTHCHIHSTDYKLEADKVIQFAQEADVRKIICVGADVPDSKQALTFAKSHENCWASIGLHPHDARLGQETYEQLRKLVNDEVIAIGECGLDYYYNHSSKKDQEAALHFQIQLAQENNLPMIFHIRDAFEDFWPIFDQYPNTRGVVHSFTAGREELDQILSRDLLVGLNGIITFTKDAEQLEAAKTVPASSLVLETDAPFLTPTPNRGKVNEPNQILTIAKFLSDLREESLEDLSIITTQNAEMLFGI